MFFYNISCLFDLDFEGHLLPGGCLVVGIALCFDFDCHLVGALLQFLLDCDLTGLLVDLEVFLEGLLSLLGRNELIGLLTLSLLRELDHL